MAFGDTPEFKIRVGAQGYSGRIPASDMHPNNPNTRSEDPHIPCTLPRRLLDPSRLNYFAGSGLSEIDPGMRSVRAVHN